MPARAQAAAPAALVAPASGGIDVLRGSHMSYGEGGSGSGGPGVMTNYDAKLLLSGMQPRVSPTDAAHFQVYGLGIGQLQAGLAQSNKAYQEALALAGNDPAKIKAAGDQYIASKLAVQNRAQELFKSFGLPQLQTIEGLRQSLGGSGMAEPQ